MANFFIASDDVFVMSLESLNFNPNQATATPNLKSAELVSNAIALFAMVVMISMLLSPSGFLYLNLINIRIKLTLLLLK